MTITEKPKLGKQQMRVLEHLRTQGNITSLEAIQLYGITRLADVIFKLRKRGYDIQTLPATVLNRYGEPCNIAYYVLTED